MLRSGQLVGYQVPLSRRDPRSRGKWGAWRILDPGARFARYLKESEQHLEHIPLLSTAEEVLGVRPGTIRQLKKRGQLQGQATPNETLYTAQELRRFLLSRESRAEGQKLYSPTLGRWARALIAQDVSIQAEVLDKLLKEAVGLEEPLKSKYVVKMWEYFDAVNSLLRSAKLGEDVALAVSKTKPMQLDPRSYLPRAHVLSKYLDYNNLHP